MGKNSVILKAKTTVKEIHWPSFKNVAVNTIYVAVTATIFALLIKLWSIGIEAIVAEVIKLFA